MANGDGSMDEEVLIVYTNWRGLTAERHILPRPGTLRFAATEHHPEPQWVFDAWDMERGVERTFALKDVSSWKACPPNA